MHFYINPILPIVESPHRVVKYPILYLQKIRRILIKIVDMRTNMIKCEYYFTNIVGSTSVIEFI
ncbi:hypothetical protein CN339_26290 [Bacillus thuringiensis]|nr:hypothetical protein CN339_26290 [Bacillus thuringiensis]